MLGKSKDFSFFALGKIMKAIIYTIILLSLFAVTGNERTIMPAGNHFMLTNECPFMSKDVYFEPELENCQHLKKYDEVCFIDLSLNVDEFYRIIFEQTLGSSLIISYSKHSDNLFYVSVKEMPYRSFSTNLNRNSSLYFRMQKKIDQEQWKWLLKVLDDMDFWHIEQGEFWEQYDGSNLTIEGFKNGKKHIFFYNIPDVYKKFFNLLNIIIEHSEVNPRDYE
jgi:hypothetical protein